MREYAAGRGWTATMQVKEVSSGATQRQLRENLLEAARLRNRLLLPFQNVVLLEGDGICIY